MYNFATGGFSIRGGLKKSKKSISNYFYRRYVKKTITKNTFLLAVFLRKPPLKIMHL